MLRCAPDRAGLGQHQGFGLDRGERGGGVGPGRFDDREGAGGAQRLDDIRRRGIGDDDERTLQRHDRCKTRGESAAA